MSILKKPLFSLFVVVLIIAMPLVSFGAIDFSFSLIDPDGWDTTGDMKIEIVGNKLTATVNNTSKTMMGDEILAPGITGFGFELKPDLGPAGNFVTSWNLKASDIKGVSENIGDYWDLVFNENWDGIKVDFMSHTDLGGKGALYNPDLLDIDNFKDALGGPPRYFTTATLEMIFEESIEIDESTTWYSFMRMQNVGPSGNLSVKLWDDGGGGGGGSVVPEPATLVLMGVGLLGLGFGLRKKIS